MPVFGYWCERCKHETELFLHPGKKAPEHHKCEECNKSARRNWQVRLGLVGGFREYEDVHTTGKPVRITSRKQQIRFWQEHGVRNPGDPFY